MERMKGDLGEGRVDEGECMKPGISQFLAQVPSIEIRSILDKSTLRNRFYCYISSKWEYYKGSTCSLFQVISEFRFLFLSV